MKEKYWADVVVQMQNAWAHVSGSGEAQKKVGAANEQGDNVKLEATEGEQQRGAEMCCERVLTSCTKDHEMLTISGRDFLLCQKGSQAELWQVEMERIFYTSDKNVKFTTTSKHQCTWEVPHRGAASL